MEIITLSNPRWREFWSSLFERLETHSCEHNHEQAIAVLSGMDGVDTAETIAFCESRGGYCDCEIMFNCRPTIQEFFDQGHNPQECRGYVEFLASERRS